MNLVRERPATNPISESTECHPVRENTNKGGQSELQLSMLIFPDEKRG